MREVYAPQVRHQTTPLELSRLCDGWTCSLIVPLHGFCLSQRLPAKVHEHRLQTTHRSPPPRLSTT